MPPLSRREIARLSRDRRFLVRASLAIVGVATILATGLSLWIRPVDPLDPEEIRKRLVQISKEESTPVSEEGWINLFRFGMLVGGHHHRLDCRLLLPPAAADSETPIPDEYADPASDQRKLIRQLFRGIQRGETEDALAEIEGFDTFLRHRNEFLGDLHFVRREYAEAGAAYEREVENHPGSSYARRSAVIAAWRIPDPDSVGRLLEEERFRDAFATWELLPIHAGLRNYGSLARDTARNEIEGLLTWNIFPALFTAAVWFFILMPFWQPTRPRLAASGSAFVAGIASAGLTLLAVLLQENVQGFTEPTNGDIVSELIYWVAGVGLREESLKLLCFLPLAIWAARRGNDLEGMVLAALVGLGFAFRENVQYFGNDSYSYQSWMRFLTANVLHFALTGIAGFYLTRMIRRKFHGMEDFLAAFIAVVIVHGFYDALISMELFESYAPLSPFLVALIAYRFFDPLRDQMETFGAGQRISPLGVFVIGSALLTCTVFVSSATVQPYAKALASFAASVGGMVPFAFAFINRFRDL